MAGAERIELSYPGSKPVALPLCYTPILASYFAQIRMQLLATFKQDITLSDTCIYMMQLLEGKILIWHISGTIISKSMNFLMSYVCCFDDHLNRTKQHYLYLTTHYITILNQPWRDELLLSF